MNIIAYGESYYVQSDVHQLVFKISSFNKTDDLSICCATIEIVPVMPGYNYGTYVDPDDVIWQSVIDNIKSFIDSIT
jgi:hypothetical protein